MKHLLCSLLLVLGLISPSTAQEQVELPTAEPVYPGLAEVVPRVAELDEQATAAKIQISDLAETASLRPQFAIIDRNQKELDQQIAELGDPAAWSFESLQDGRALFSEQRSAIKQLLEDISDRLGELDQLRQNWQVKKEFWRNWLAILDAPQQEISRDSFSEAQGIISQVLNGVAEASPPLLALQKEVTALQKKILEVFNRVEAALNAQRHLVFKKTARSFTSSQYYRQFNAELWQKVKNRAIAILSVKEDFFRNQGWIFVLQALLALALAGFIRRHRVEAETAEEWQFILRHPLATGAFVTVVVFGPLYDNPPALWRLFLWILAVSSAAILTASLLRNPRKIFMVCLLGFLAILSMGLQIISLPQPLYRLYLAILSLTGIPLLVLLSVINLRAKQGKLDGFTLALRLGVAVLGVSFVAQFAGFSNLASRLMDASIHTVFLGLLAAMAVRLGRGSIDYLQSLKTLQQYKFFRRHGEGLADHLKGLFKAFVFVYSFLYLFEVWGFYDSVGLAWQAILSVGVTLGQATLSVRLVLLVVAALYLAMVVSWFLQALLDSQFFPRKRLDRGVKDAIKKLLHYTLVLVGFLAAVSLAGLDLRAFAVVAGAFGIGIGFGLQNIVNNFISGLILLFERPVKVGDVVVLAGEWGAIKKIGLRSTVVETWDRAEIIVPNSQLISETVTNWTLSSSVARVVVPVGVAYGSDVPLVLQILQEAAQQHPDVLEDPEPSPIFVGFGDSSLDFELRAWMSDVNKRLRVRSDLGQYVDRRFREEGVQIPFPQRDLHLRSVDEKILTTKRDKMES